ncbi:hypothetical protein, partial [Burkholderia ubonensis]|uniref:hypothetical protein n=1 Tax=Burkholderia ubonensis TaxID=101571 RepID=UPI001E30B44D
MRVSYSAVHQPTEIRNATKQAIEFHVVAFEKLTQAVDRICCAHAAAAFASRSISRFSASRS